MHFFLFLSLLLSPLASIASTDSAFHIRWAVVHDPLQGDFVNPVKALAERVKKSSKGKIKLDLVQIPFDCEAGSDPHALAYEKVKKGEIEMSQVYTFAPAIDAKSWEILDLPFLFRSHAHSAAVLNGAIGKKLNQDLYESSNRQVRALGFTYSGGFVQVMGSREVRKLEDFENLRMSRLDRRPVNHKLQEILHVNVVLPWVSNCATSKVLEEGTIDSFLGEWVRLRYVQKAIDPVKGPIKTIAETNQSLILTSVVINEAFFQKVPQPLRKILEKEVAGFVMEERRISVELAKKVKQEMIQRGLQVVEMSPSEKRRFIDFTKPITDEYRKKIRLAHWRHRKNEITKAVP